VKPQLSFKTHGFFIVNMNETEGSVGQNQRVQRELCCSREIRDNATSTYIDLVVQVVAGGARKFWAVKLS